MLMVMTARAGADRRCAWDGRVHSVDGVGWKTFAEAQGGSSMVFCGAARSMAARCVVLVVIGCRGFTKRR